MFGYIRPLQGELKVKDLTLYKAIYCGLCKTMKKEISFFLPFSISYDYVLLAAVRAAISGERFTPKKCRCAYNPLRRKMAVTSKTVLQDTALTACVLTKCALDDKIKDGDTSFLKKPFLRIYRCLVSSALSRRIKKDRSGALAFALQETEEKMRALQAMEGSGQDLLDRMAVCSGEMLSAAVALGREGEDSETLRAFFSDLGSFIYWLDAVDDLEKDAASGCFNPLLVRFGTPEKAREEILFFDMVMAQYTARMADLVKVFPASQTSGIIENICSHGLGATAREVLSREKGAEK